MAVRYYFFRAEGFNLQLIQARVPLAAALVAVAPSVTQPSLLAVSLGDDTAPNQDDLLEAMADAGFTFISSTLTPPVFTAVRHHGGLTAAPVAPVPAEGDEFYNSVYNRQEQYDGTLWNPVTPTFRPSLDDNTIPAALFVDNLTGSDDNDGLTALTAFATLRRAIQYIPSNPALTRTVNLAASGVDYAWPALATSQISFVNILGPSLTIVEPATPITSINASSYTNGISISVAGAPWVVDQHRGRLIQFITGPLAGAYGVIISNTVNMLNVTQDTRAAAYLLPVVGNTFTIEEQGATISFPDGATPVIESSVQLNFQNLKFSGADRVLSINNTDKAEFLRCRFDLLGILSGRGGSSDYRTCYIRNVGDPSQQNGMMAANTDGVLELADGTVVDGEAAAAANGHISSQAGSTIRLFGEVVLSQAGTNGLLIREGAVYTRRTTITTFAALRFLDGSVGGVVVNPSGEGIGGDIDLPDLFGSISAAYGIRAMGGAAVKPGDLSSLTSSTGLNKWSADDGANNIATNSDATQIFSPGWAYTRLGPDFQEFSFTFASGSPFLLTPLRAGDRMMRAVVVIDTVFNGAGAGVQLGTAASPGGIFSTADIDVTVADYYQSLQIFQLAVTANLQLEITPGAGATQGSGRVLLEVWRS